ncbi:LpqB family beta-propeller domain-containing protein [Varibaculum vaginae]|uniref:LpqB family beta-propeller domain-containing protein n=1 Tax=Varibaculum vaginae TaxID=2364797 RepID=UPI000F07A118|nr:LpqB family beta-propeller domain-containing protein [Varibaculum vaginae]
MNWIGGQFVKLGIGKARVGQGHLPAPSAKIKLSSRNGKNKFIKSILLAILAAFTTSVLVSCAALPDSGPVHKGEVNIDSRNPLSQLASGPMDGASPEKLLADFQQACAAGTYDDYGIARQFLTTAQRQSWKPQERVTVLNPKTELKIIFDPETNEVTGVGQPSLRLNKAGISQKFRTEETIKYSLAKEKGQWRISSLPDGVVLTSSAFKNAFAKRNVYYWSSDHRFLVPDPRWIPRKNGAQHLLESLFSGPSEDISPAVSALETMKKIPSNLVTLQSNKATVVLPDTVHLRSEQETSQLYQQLRATLLNVSGIDEVVLSQNGSSLTVPSEQSAASPKPIMLGIKNGEVVEESESRSGVFTSPANADGDITWPTPSNPVTDFHVAIRGKNELVRLQRGKPAALLYRGKDLRPPQVDAWGWAFTGASAQKGALVAVNSRGTTVELKLPTDSKWKIPFFALGSPGVRGVVVWQVGYSFQAQLVTVLRGEDGTPRQIVPAQDKTEVMRDVISVAWINPGQVAILQGGTSSKVQVVGINSYGESFDAPVNAQYLVPNPPDGNVEVVSDRGFRLGHIEQSWRILGSDIFYPAYSPLLAN